MIWLRFKFKAATRLELFVPNAWVPYATLLLKPALKINFMQVGLHYYLTERSDILLL